MKTHDRMRNVFAEACQNWRAFAYVMQVHENRHIKRAGVAGIRARATPFRDEWFKNFYRYVNLRILLKLSILLFSRKENAC
ncbi:hypothetical protein WP34_11680 [Salmonella enterica subsp. enterica serovar Virchow]|uniref:Uncharacterized protein n=1 Tax=Salmonella paratyphi B TaxID=57045 RepID=A0A737Z9P3_SALEB|nr:hypothetical protein [Salmonella enterica subsp. enterica serovar Java]EBC8641172.1 hypothetical protein [Salmonella enterica]EBL5775993.1 hypothetical protein [Salmonella enterica subsp. enterica serovar Virchow]HAE8672602.1 hypothetical protein [Salmonella enterica subsp. enterica serovar Paratyphi B]EBH2115054.1 hypothetical protein [Salmonella enterica]